MGASETTTVRVLRSDGQRLEALAASRDVTVPHGVHVAICALEKQEFGRGINAEYARVRADPELRERSAAEVQEWDSLP